MPCMEVKVKMVKFKAIYHNIKFHIQDLINCFHALMNKHFTKIIALENNVLTPNWLSVNLNNVDKSKILSYKSNKFKFPVVLKPNSKALH